MLPPVAPALRNAIRFEGAFKLKVKQVDAAHDRAVAFLQAFTPFAGWDEVTLRVRPPRRSPAQDALIAELEHPPPGADRWRHREQRFDLAALTARGVELDNVGVAALAQLGPSEFTSCERMSNSAWCALTWVVKASDVPAPWLALCVAHAGRTVETFDQVSVTATTNPLALLAPTTRAPLPFQHESHYPPWRAGHTDRIPCAAHAYLFLPRRQLVFGARFPFETDDHEFRTYVAALEAALGQPLSRKRWYRVLANKAGTGQYERKLEW